MSTLIQIQSDMELLQSDMELFQSDIEVLQSDMELLDSCESGNHRVQETSESVRIDQVSSVVRLLQLMILNPHKQHLHTNA